MSSGFDPYHEWLDIDPREQPADHYRLLGLARFETDETRIAAAADERMALVRRYQTGKRRAYTQRLLNELSAARVCLLDPQAKARYDEELAKYLTQLVAWNPQSAEPAQAPVWTAAASEPSGTSAAARSEIRQARPHAHLPPRMSSRRGQLLALSIGLGALLAGVAWYALPWAGIHLVPAAADRDKTPVLAPPNPSAPARPAPQRVLTAAASGEIAFALDAAELAGTVRRETVGGAEALTHWNAPEAAARWEFRVVKPGFFRAEVTYATLAGVDDGELELRIDGRAKSCSLRSTGGVEQFVTDEAPIAVTKSGQHNLTLVSKGPPADNWLVIRSVRFIPLAAAAPQ